jgi:nitrogen fixation protein FixH
MTPNSRNPWPIAITVFFIIAFSGLIAFIVFATTQHVDLVRSDYYEEEVRFQEQLDRVNRTRQIAGQVTVAYDSVQQCITVHLPAAQAAGASGHIHLYRPSDARLDQELPLQLTAEGSQRVPARQLRSGLWKVRVQWSVGGQEYYYDDAVVIRSPAV